MREMLGRVDAGRLERSCGPAVDSIQFGTSAPGFERAEVSLARSVFEPHRHDTYTIGVTTTGVQTFRYRGSRHICLPGQMLALHPDEVHDGAPGTPDGFGYRVLYLAPGLVRDALGGEGLPFVADPVQTSPDITRIAASLLADMSEPITDLGHAGLTTRTADLLRLLARGRSASAAPIDAAAVKLARDYLDAHACEQTLSATLERVTGTDRFTLARQFRQAYGTSPDRYRTLRRLALARARIERGDALAGVAIETGFADQSHLTRQFKRTYGLTPGRWAALAARP
jgi:AraC-like DNA-binding protein